MKYLTTCVVLLLTLPAEIMAFASYSLRNNNNSQCGGNHKTAWMIHHQTLLRDDANAMDKTHTFRRQNSASAMHLSPNDDCNKHKIAIEAEKYYDADPEYVVFGTPPFPYGADAPTPQSQRTCTLNVSALDLCLKVAGCRVLLEEMAVQGYAVVPTLSSKPVGAIIQSKLGKCMRLGTQSDEQEYVLIPCTKSIRNLFKWMFCEPPANDKPGTPSDWQ